MTGKLLEAYAKIEALKAELMGMQALNVERRMQGHAMAYDEAAFMDIGKQISAIGQSVKDIEVEKPTKSKRFNPPSPHELAEFCKESGYPPKFIQRFIDHFSSNGWLVGGKAKMKDWQAAYRNFCKNNGFQPDKAERQTESQTQAQMEFDRLMGGGQ